MSVKAGEGFDTSVLSLDVPSPFGLVFSLVPECTINITLEKDFKMEIPKLYSDEDFHFSTMLINPDVVNAFKLRTRIFLDPQVYSEDSRLRAEQDFRLDLSKMVDLFNASKGTQNISRINEETINKFLELCLGFRIQLLENVQDAMPFIAEGQNEVVLNSLLEDSLMEVL